MEYIQTDGNGVERQELVVGDYLGFQNLKAMTFYLHNDSGDRCITSITADGIYDGGNRVLTEANIDDYVVFQDGDGDGGGSAGGNAITTDNIADYVVFQ